MNNGLVKDVIKLHFDLIDAVYDYMPPHIKADLLAIQKDFTETAMEHAKKQEGESESVQNIPIS